VLQTDDVMGGDLLWILNEFIKIDNILTTFITVLKATKPHKITHKISITIDGKARKSKENKEKRRKSKIFTVLVSGGEGEI
jgi:hypothetical protein